MQTTINKYESLTKESKADIVDVIKSETTKAKKKLNEKEIDSIKQELKNKMKNPFIPIPEAARKKIIEELEEDTKDSIKNDNDGFNIKLGVDSRLEKFIAYQKKHPKSSIDVALDSLKYDKNFTNRFLYTRAKTANNLKSKESRDQFINKMLSYSSVALFVFLPFFTLFLKFFYLRRKYTYVDHLIFVFHIQTVFFMLFSILYILLIFDTEPKIWIFILLFLLYLIIAMKQFYQQGYFKTFTKFLLLNLSYIIVASIGALFVLLISFALF
ncbi:hypothetical protein [uncultured Polaribacter sp.]|uniref:hypothetical protein n=1 Tax=uncultured Polaribacter sp. TaxID=174711 RepID=UPI002604DD6D|nr:hypothetical protein [uncultured Polaribacter sp.]